MPRLLVGVLCASFVLTAPIHEGVAAERPAANVTTDANDDAKKDRIMGSIMGVLIGDALGVGSHWYYDLEEFKADFWWVS